MDQLQKAGGPATSVGINRNRARVRLFFDDAERQLSLCSDSYRGSPFDDCGDPWRAAGSRIAWESVPRSPDCSNGERIDEDDHQGGAISAACLVGLLASPQAGGAEEMPLAMLKRAYPDCERRAVHEPTMTGEIAQCLMIYEGLKRRGFDGNWKKVRQWTQDHLTPGQNAQACGAGRPRIAADVRRSSVTPCPESPGERQTVPTPLERALRRRAGCDKANRRGVTTMRLPTK